jgi:4-hydroxy-4-methyl-2-oxoglutarate aldolase
MMDSVNRDGLAEVPPETLAGLARQAASTVYEAAGRIGAMSGAIRPIGIGMRLCGPALPVRCQPADNLTLHAAVALAQPGEVIVADVGAFTEAGHWGEVLTVAAQSRGVAGLVIDGGVRDVEAAQRRAFPIFAGGFSMKATVKELLGAIGQPIVCGGVAVRLGDIVVGDDDGVLVLPRELAAEALRSSITRETAETEVMRRLAMGELTLDILGFRGKLHGGSGPA